MKKREEMTPEEIQEFMRREQEELDKLIGKAPLQPATPVQEEDESDEVVTFDPVSGEAFEVESTILTREKPSENIIVEGEVMYESYAINKEPDVFNSQLLRKAAEEIFSELKTTLWDIQETAEKLRGMYLHETHDELIDKTEEMMMEARLLKSFSAGLKEFNEMTKIQQEQVERRAKAYTEELLKLL